MWENNKNLTMYILAHLVDNYCIPMSIYLSMYLDMCVLYIHVQYYFLKESKRILFWREFKYAKILLWLTWRQKISDLVLTSNWITRHHEVNK